MGYIISMYLASEQNNVVQNRDITKPADKSRATGFMGWFNRLSRGKKIILVVMTIWAIQAVPKWTVAITADGELSAKIMKVFIEPKTYN